MKIAKKNVKGSSPSARSPARSSCPPRVTQGPGLLGQGHADRSSATAARCSTRRSSCRRTARSPARSPPSRKQEKFSVTAKFAGNTVLTPPARPGGSPDVARVTPGARRWRSPSRRSPRVAAARAVAQAQVDPVGCTPTLNYDTVDPDVGPVLRRQARPGRGRPARLRHGGRRRRRPQFGRRPPTPTPRGRNLTRSSTSTGTPRRGDHEQPARAS